MAYQTDINIKSTCQLEAKAEIEADIAAAGHVPRSSKMYQPHPFHHCILLIVCYHLSSSHSAPIAEVARVNIPSSDEYANSLALSSTDPSSKVFTSYQVRPYPQRPLADGTTTNNRPMSFSQFILNLIQQLSRSVGLLWNQFRCTVIRITMQGKTLGKDNDHRLIYFRITQSGSSFATSTRHQHR